MADKKTSTQLKKKKTPAKRQPTPSPRKSGAKAQDMDRNAAYRGAKNGLKKANRIVASHGVTPNTSNDRKIAEGTAGPRRKPKTKGR